MDPGSADLAGPFKIDHSSTPRYEVNPILEGGSALPIEYLIKETCEDLINLYKKQTKEPSKLTKTRLFIPPCRIPKKVNKSPHKNSEDPESNLRISEQEARFCFAAAVERVGGYFYSVETPTLETYSFTDGGGKISAQTDLTLWNLDGKTKEFNIEFKAHNPQQYGVDKDIEKLVKESTKGVWFHLFENNFQDTFPALAKKFLLALLDPKINGLRKRDLLFAVCVLKKGRCIIGSLPDSVKSEEAIMTFFEEGQQALTSPGSFQGKLWKVLMNNVEGPDSKK